LFDRAVEHGFRLLIENRDGLLFLKVVSPEAGTVAMWPAFQGSIEGTARYAIRCFEHFRTG
jgi:hypothetical protein